MFYIHSESVIKKTFIISLSVILFIIEFLTIIIVKDNFVNNEFNDEIFLDTSHENSEVVIRYPQISDDRLEDINMLIKKFVENIASERYGEDYINLNLEVSTYKITYYKNDLLSIVFEANGYVSTAASPNNFLSAINIDLETASIISLSDIYFIDDDFTKVIDNNFHEQFLPKKLKEWGINKDHELYNKYKKDLAFEGPCNLQDTILDKKRFYFSENTLVICAGVEHAIGDHFEIEVEFSELKEYLKTNIKPFV